MITPIKLSEVDLAKRLAFLLRAQTDCLVLAADQEVSKENREKLRLAADILSEVRL